MDPAVEAGEIPLSQATSHFPIDGITADVLFDREVSRRDGLKARGNVFTGCHELDEQVLLGGFERGCVVGISAEEEQVGLLIGLQSIARLLLSGDSEARSAGGSGQCRALIVTTLSTNALMPVLRNVVREQVRDVQNKSSVVGSSNTAGDRGINAEVQTCLEAISIARIFDFEGLSEVLRELDLSASEQPQRAAAAPSKPAVPEEKARPAEIQDSEDEGSLSSPASSSEARGIPGDTAEQDQQAPTPAYKPDVILVTHMSALLGSLFARREKTSAHTLVQLLSSQLRYLSRAHERSGSPLILLLNSTSSSPSFPLSTDHSGPADSSSSHMSPAALRARPRPGGHRSRSSKPLDPTLRSLFSPPSLSAAHAYAAYSYHGAAATATAGVDHARHSNKPAFGLVFTQLLDMHLLCTWVPRTRRDAELFCAAEEEPEEEEEEGREAGVAAPQFACVVEVLLDEIGVWGTGGSGKVRRSREQRWGAVDVVDDRAVVDAFARPVRKGGGEVGRPRVVGGFGGPRV